MLDNDEMRPLAEQDIQLCTDQLQKLQEEIRIAILPKDEADQHAAIIEIRAGTSYIQCMNTMFSWLCCSFCYLSVKINAATIQTQLVLSDIENFML